MRSPWIMFSNSEIIFLTAEIMLRDQRRRPRILPRIFAKDPRNTFLWPEAASALLLHCETQGLKIIIKLWSGCDWWLALLMSVQSILALYCIVVPLIPGFPLSLSTQTLQTWVWQGYTINILPPDTNHFYWHKQYNTAIHSTARRHQLDFTWLPATSNYVE